MAATKERLGILKNDNRIEKKTKKGSALYKFLQYKAFPCPHCESQYSVKGTLTNHMKAKHPEHLKNIYQCIMCPKKSYIQFKGLLTHTKICHGELQAQIVKENHDNAELQRQTQAKTALDQQSGPSNQLPHVPLVEVNSPLVQPYHPQTDHTLNGPIDSLQPISASITKAPDSPCYRRLLALEEIVLVQNTEPFECPICITDIDIGEGVILRECLHPFCRECLRAAILDCQNGRLICMYRDNDYACDFSLLQNEIKELVNKEEYEKYLKKSLMVAEKEGEKTFHCKTPNCEGWCYVGDDNDVQVFECPVCQHYNCIPCQGIHPNERCLDYRYRMEEQDKSSGAYKTKEYINNAIRKGDAMPCPRCGILVSKIEGCDYVTCSSCQTGICWVTKGPRWGPKGTGDTSGGCRCGLNGKRCAPKCRNCH